MASAGSGPEDAASERVAVNASGPLPSPEPTAAPADATRTSSPRSVLLAQLTEMVRMAHDAGDHEAVRVVNEALGRLLAAPEQPSGDTADVVRLSAGRARKGQR
ncbi:hypothetical protein [Sorangium sp. So ce693]|uniref:hypothetical protein n=1 Tax=Sorangium sp. So ce693 TaxID=3133318 RepID=UPI003F5DA581